jgi:hypothetical protein
MSVLKLFLYLNLCSRTVSASCNKIIVTSVAMRCNVLQNVCGNRKWRLSVSADS